jgi:transposase InsO family protein
VLRSINSHLEALVAHANARLTVHGRLLLVRRVLSGHKPGEVAKQLGVSRQTVYKWVRRYLAEGLAGLADGSSRPHSTPRATSAETTARIVALRLALHAGPIRIAAALGLAASTVGAVIRREGLPQLADLDRITGEVIRSSARRSNIRYEHRNPGDLLHIDVKKLGRIPDGGGWRIHGQDTKLHRTSRQGWDYVHVAVDDHSRVAYIEILPDETGDTCAGFLHRAVGWFRNRGVIIRRVLTDNAMAYRLSKTWAAVCSALQIKRRFTKPGCPWTNGKAERLNRTLQTEWAYSKAWTSNADRTAALAAWLAYYNNERAHTSLGGHTPISRLAA